MREFASAYYCMRECKGCHILKKVKRCWVRVAKGVSLSTHVYDSYYFTCFLGIYLFFLRQASDFKDQPVDVRLELVFRLNAPDTRRILCKRMYGGERQW